MSLLPVAASRALLRQSTAIDRAASWSVAAVSIALLRHSSACFFAPSTTLSVFPLQPLPAAAAPGGTEIPPALIKPAIPMPASNFFISLLFMMSLRGLKVEIEIEKRRVILTQTHSTKHMVFLSHTSSEKNIILIILDSCRNSITLFGS